MNEAKQSPFTSFLKKSRFLRISAVSKKSFYRDITWRNGNFRFKIYFYYVQLKGPSGEIGIGQVLVWSSTVEYLNFFIPEFFERVQSLTPLGTKSFQLLVSWNNSLFYVCWNLMHTTRIPKKPERPILCLEGSESRLSLMV